MNKDDVLKILKIIDESGYDEVRLEVGDLKLHVQKAGAAGLPAQAPSQNFAASAAPAGVQASVSAPAAKASAPAALAAAPSSAAETIPAGMIAVRAPMLGTFYRAPSPGERPFVEVGDEVGAEDTVCLVEVMKLFNSIKAGSAGRVTKILVENAAMVEHGQLLLLIQPK
ncbi:MAG: acetyl-CoA carboxylase biotin carboxyl carrier protein [Burkholderiales bacterium]|nr:acetyl-CoA carboxylase biotin carboxyl carrier protein [Burkholderiales bacterium]